VGLFTAIAAAASFDDICPILVVHITFDNHFYIIAICYFHDFTRTNTQHWNLSNSSWC